jgi:hypothetical protein
MILLGVVELYKYYNINNSKMTIADKNKFI